MVDRIFGRHPKEVSPVPAPVPVQLNFDHDKEIASHMIKSDNRLTQRHRLRQLSIPTFHGAYIVPGTLLLAGQPHVALVAAIGLGAAYGVEKAAALTMYVRQRVQKGKAIREAKLTGDTPSPLAAYVRRMKEKGDNEAKAVLAVTTVSAAAEIQKGILAHAVSGHAVVLGHAAGVGLGHAAAIGAAAHAAPFLHFLFSPLTFIGSLATGALIADHNEKHRSRENAMELSYITLDKNHGKYQRRRIFNFLNPFY